MRDGNGALLGAAFERWKRRLDRQDAVLRQGRLDEFGVYTFRQQEFAIILAVDGAILALFLVLRVHLLRQKNAIKWRASSETPSRFDARNDNKQTVARAQPLLSRRVWGGVVGYGCGRGAPCFSALFQEVDNARRRGSKKKQKEEEEKKVPSRRRQSLSSERLRSASVTSFSPFRQIRKVASKAACPFTALFGLTQQRRSRRSQPDTAQRVLVTK